jgi:phosphate transport system protein
VLERRPIDTDLQTLTGRLTVMGQLAEQRVRSATGALVHGDDQYLQEIIDGDKLLNDLQMEIDNRCFALLALYQPVAVDLRFVVAATRLSAVLERVGDLAVNIAQVGQRYFEHRPITPLVDLPRISALAHWMLTTAVRAFLERKESLARSVIHGADEFDEFRVQVLRDLLTDMHNDPRLIEPGIDLILIARHLERIGIQALNIAEETMFITGVQNPRERLVP